MPHHRGDTFRPPSDLPAWARAFAESVCACFNDVEGSEAGFDYTYFGPGTQHQDDHLFLFGPKTMMLSEGADQEEEVFEPLRVDVQAVQELFTRIEATSYQSARGEGFAGRRRLTLTGQLGEHRITVHILDEPLLESAPGSGRPF